MSFQKAPNLYGFSDYRDFLKKSFESKKKRNPQWSYSSWAKKLGLKNNTSLLKILSGEREAGEQITAKLESYFEFGEKQKNYFRLLIAYSKTKFDPHLHALIHTQLLKAHPKKRFQGISLEEFELISKWYGYAIWQATYLKSFQCDPKTIADLFLIPVSPMEVKNMLLTLHELGIIQLSPDGKSLKASKSAITTPDGIPSEGLKQFHESMLDHAKTAIRKVNVNDRSVSGITFAIKKSQIEQAKEFISQFEQEFAEKFKPQSGSDAVYHLETALFPLTK